MQLTDFIDVDMVPLLQFLHAIEPILEEYVPFGHLVQCSLLENEYDPALHRLQFELSLVERVPAGHGTHAVALSIVCVLDPASHSMHSSRTALGAYLPGVL